jgi:hypothetical protein
VQGETGWYYEPRENGRAVPMFFEVDQSGEWIRRPEVTGAPVSETRQAMARSKGAGELRLSTPS